MRLAKLAVVTLSLALAGHALADTATAKSKVANDTCTVTAMDKTLKGDDGKDMPGVMFTFESKDGDRLDVHSKHLTIKANSNTSVFVPNLTVADVVKDFHFDEHAATAGADAETNRKTQAKFVKNS